MMQYLEQATENQIHDWFLDAKPGERFCYFRGHLARDRSVDTSRFASDDDVRALGYIASKVFGMAERGLILLVQKRHGDSDYEYRAVRSR